MSTAPSGYQSILDLLIEIGKAQDADALMAALVMVYVGIDTMTRLSMPVGETTATGQNFSDWVDTYMKADAAQSYQYAGRDVYAARCAVLHTYGSLADLHRRANPPKTFGYLDNGPHLDDGSGLVLISIAVLIHDSSAAVHRCVDGARTNTDLKARIDSRLDGVFSVWPVSHAGAAGRASASD